MSAKPQIASTPGLLSLQFVLLFAALILLEGGYLAARTQLAHHLPLGFAVAGARYSLTPAEAAAADLAQRVQQYLATPLVLQFGTQKLALPPAQLGLSISPQKTLTAARGQLLQFGAAKLAATVDAAKLRAAVLAQLPELEKPAQNARAKVVGGQLQIVPETPGQTVAWGALAGVLTTRAATLSTEPILALQIPLPPAVAAATLAANSAALTQLLAAPVTLLDTPYRRFELNLADRLDWLEWPQADTLFQKRDPTAAPMVRINPAKLHEFVTRELAPAVNESPAGVQIARDLAGKVQFDGVARPGRVVAELPFLAALQAALARGETTVAIPFQTLPAAVAAGPELQKLGIRELLGSNETSFAGSPATRLKNIAAAAAKVNGLLLPPGAEFSFVQAASPITVANGYTEGLVIKKGEVEPEVGGGVCQVSTTIFRSILAAGLPVTQQRAHSLKVSYYDPPGLDATIYPGSVDFRFVNDTPAHVLLQTHLEGARLRVNIFGTSDGRTAVVAGPFYPDGQPVTDLAKAGLRLKWTRALQLADGTQKTEEYRANYRAVH